MQVFNATKGEDGSTQYFTVDEVAQAEVYTKYLKGCLNNTQVCTVFQTWGITDDADWTYNSLPFDENMEPKEAYWELLNTANAYA